MSSGTQPTNATVRKDRLYSQLAASLKRLKQQEARSTDLMGVLQADLDAMRTFAGIHAAQCVFLFAAIFGETLIPSTCTR